MPDGGVFGDILWINDHDEPEWISGFSLGLFGVAGLTVVDGIASFLLDGRRFSFPVIGAGNVSHSGIVNVTVEDGVATLTGGDLDHSFPVFGTPGSAAVGMFIPSVSEGVASFTLGASTYSFVVVES